MAYTHSFNLRKNMHLIHQYTLLFFFFVIITPSTVFGKTPLDLGALKKGVVGLRTHILRSAQKIIQDTEGTGYLANRDKGYIVTHAHLINTSGPAIYNITFHNGLETEAFLVYSDPEERFAILRVDPQNIPEDVPALAHSEREGDMDEILLIIGRSGDDSSSMAFYTGRLTNKLDTFGAMGIPNAEVSMNVPTEPTIKGGPVIGADGKVIGLTLGMNRTAVGFLPIRFLQDSLEAVVSDKMPKRYHLGGSIFFYKLGDAAKFHYFPKEALEKYTKDYPESRLNVLSIAQARTGHKLQARDILWKVNGTAIGPDQYKLEKILNNAEKEVTLGIFRQGKYQEITVPLHNWHDSLHHTILFFGGAYFYEASHLQQLAFNLPKGSVMLGNRMMGSAFFAISKSFNPNVLIPIQILSVDGQAIRSLEELKNVVIRIQKEKKRYFSVTYLLHTGLSEPFQLLSFKSTNPFEQGIEYDPSSDRPEWLTLDSKTHIWKTSTVTLPEQQQKK